MGSDDAQQHQQEPPPRPQAAAVNPYRRGDRVRLNELSRGKWAKRADHVGYVAEDPGRYMVSVYWVWEPTAGVDGYVRARLAAGLELPGTIDLFHHGWLEPAPAPPGEAAAEEGGGDAGA